MSSPAAPDPSPSRSADRPWEGLSERLGRAATLDANLFREVADDSAATGPALAVVLGAAALSGLGRLLGEGLPGLFAGLGQGCLVWGLWLLGVHASSLLIGIESDLSRLFRALGFAAVGFSLGLLEGLPLLGVLFSLAKWGLVFAAFAVAVRALSGAELGRALLACGAGLLAAILLSVPFAPLFPGSFARIRPAARRLTLESASWPTLCGPLRARDSESALGPFPQWIPLGKLLT